MRNIPTNSIQFRPNKHISVLMNTNFIKDNDNNYSEYDYTGTIVNSKRKQEESEGISNVLKKNLRIHVGGETYLVANLSDSIKLQS